MGIQIKEYFATRDYEVIEAVDGYDALDKVNQDIDMVLLDIMMPGMDGYETCKKIREKYDMPIIFISALSETDNMLDGYHVGADDYITKPFSTKELVLRVNNIIKRVYKNEVNKITYDKYSINLDKRIVLKGDKEITLTTLEFDLLSMFVTNKNKSFSRDDILNNIWGENYFGTDRVVDDLVRRLRKKMPLLNINTIYGFGYRLT